MTEILEVRDIAPLFFGHRYQYVTHRSRNNLRQCPLGTVEHVSVGIGTVSNPEKGDVIFEVCFRPGLPRCFRFMY